MTQRFGDRVSVKPEHRFTGFDGYKKVVELREVNYVILASPPGFRPSHLEAAIGAGKHVFTEKPVAVDGPGIRKVLELAKVADSKGLNIVALKMMRVTPELAKKHYAEHVNKAWYPALESFITGGPIVAAVIEGLEAIRVVREMLGATSGLKAAPGTIRGDYSASRQMNLVHGTDGPESSQREIALYFREDELCAHEPTISRWLRATDEV